MSTVRVYTRKCAECGRKFEVSGPAAGRRILCSAKCQRVRQLKHEANWREAHYDPWKWENTILDWWE